MNIDDKIANALQEAGEMIEVNEWMLAKMKANLMREKQQKERSIMKKKHIKWLAVGAVLLMTSTAAYAVSNLSNHEMHVNHNQDITEPPSASLLNEKVGYAPQYVEAFTNGWAFKSVSIVKNSADVQENGDVQEWQSLDFSYTKKGAGDTWVSLSTDKESAYGIPEGETVRLASGADSQEAVYVEQKFKFVPPSYEPTEADKIAEENGSLTISYGADKIEEEAMRYVTWVKDGIVYQLMTNCTDVDRTALLTMSEEVLAAK